MTFTDKQSIEKKREIAIYENRPYALQMGKIAEDFQVELRLKTSAYHMYLSRS